MNQTVSAVLPVGPVKAAGIIAASPALIKFDPPHRPPGTYPAIYRRKNSGFLIKNPNPGEGVKNN
jgi:hypothetical protein